VHLTLKPSDHVSHLQGCLKEREGRKAEKGGEPAREGRTMFDHMENLFSHKKEMKGHFSGWRKVNSIFFPLDQ
jgi:hypothetical protein